MKLYKKIVAIIETSKRNRIINRLSYCFDFAICEGILLSGSMVFGKNHSIRKDSDIDLLLIIKAKNIFKIKENNFLSSPHYDDRTLELFNKKISQAFWFDIFVNKIMINIGVYEYQYFKNFCDLKEKKLLRTKLDNKFKKRTLRTIDGRQVKSLVTQYKDGTNYIINYPLYYKNKLLATPNINGIAINKVLYSKNNDIQELKDNLIKNLKYKYTKNNLLVLFDYQLCKATNKYKKQFIKNLSKNNHNQKVVGLPTEARRA